jgi:hypothetical protein
MYDLDLCIVYLDVLTRGVFVVILYILLWVPSWTCVTIATWFHLHHMHATTCTRRFVVRFQSNIVRIVAWLLRSRRYWFWGVTSGIRARFCRYPPVQSACRITLPTDVVEFSVKPILLKMHWIDLSRSSFFSLPSMLSLLLSLRLLSPLSYLLWVLGSYVGGRSLAFYPNRSISLEGLHR